MNKMTLQKLDYELQQECESHLSHKVTVKLAVISQVDGFKH